MRITVEFHNLHELKAFAMAVKGEEVPAELHEAILQANRAATEVTKELEK